MTDKLPEEPITVPRPVYDELELVRTSGEYNMFTEVLEGLREFGCETALDWVQNNPDTYVQGFFHGIAPADTDDTASTR